MADAPDNMPEQADGSSADTEGRPNQIVVLRDYCTRVRGADCSRCALACPHDAIGFAEDGRPTIDTDACTRCGICLGICDAFSSSRVTMIDVHARIRRIALRGEDVVLTCKENVFPGLEPAANVVVLPCLACLSPEFWTLVLTENIPVRIAADLAYCADCERAGEMGEMLYAHAVETAEEWSGAKVGYLDEIPEKENLVRDLANPEGVDRRSAFTNLVSDVGDIASGKRRLRNSDVLQQFYERKERARARARLNLVDGVQFNDFRSAGPHEARHVAEAPAAARGHRPQPGYRGRACPSVLSETDRSRCTNSLDCVAASPHGRALPQPRERQAVLRRALLHRMRPVRGRVPAAGDRARRSHRGRIPPRRRREPGTPDRLALEARSIA